MPANEIHVNDIGTQFVITIQDGDGVTNLSTATTLQIIFHKPDGSEVTKTATLYTDGTDGNITYTTTTGVLDQAGNWKLQAYIVIGVNSWHTDIANFKVYPNLG